MEHSATLIYGPVYELILKMQKAPPEELSALQQELYELNEKTRYKFMIFDEEFEKIRNDNIEIKEKLQKLNILLDERFANTSKDDLTICKISCENIYGGYWDKLDELSQKYLIMANYLYRLFSNSDKDFSPSVLEYGRAVENELTYKIYKGYVERLSVNTSRMTDNGSRYGELRSAVRSYTNNNGEFYIPARAMVKYLKYLSDDYINEYNEALKGYLASEGINEHPISENSFTSEADIIFDKYRNSAAHPGRTISEHEALKCKEKSKKVLKQFMSAL